MKNKWIDSEITYDGTQLRSQWIFHTCGMLGDAIASFEGPADVPLANMVDQLDVVNKEPIFSKKMLHFIVETFDGDLKLAIARQRILVAIASEELRRLARVPSIERRGDDLYEGDRKISVSIATASPVSCLIHFAMNIVSQGTPVRTKGLADYGVNQRQLAAAISQRFCEEMDSMNEARCKVRAVE